MLLLLNIKLVFAILFTPKLKDSNQKTINLCNREMKSCFVSLELFYEIDNEFDIHNENH
jgi:hypothetical protein